jgi:hypothetical protein
MTRPFKPAQLSLQTQPPGAGAQAVAVRGARSVDTGLASRLVTLFAVTCGLLVANVYYSQPIAGPIAASLGMPVGATGLVVTATQAGFGLGLLFIVPWATLSKTVASCSS